MVEARVIIRLCYAYVPEQALAKAANARSDATPPNTLLTSKPSCTQVCSNRNSCVGMGPVTHRPKGTGRPMAPWSSGAQKEEPGTKERPTPASQKWPGETTSAAPSEGTATPAPRTAEGMHAKHGTTPTPTMSVETFTAACPELVVAATTACNFRLRPVSGPVPLGGRPRLLMGAPGCHGGGPRGLRHIQDLQCRVHHELSV